MDESTFGNILVAMIVVPFVYYFIYDYDESDNTNDEDNIFNDMIFS